MKRKIDEEILNAMSRNPANWRGVFNYNPKDPRIRVPKINPMMGWTLNFGSIYSYVIIIAVILILVASQFLL
ncbi:hypothetical protein ACUNWD_18005 [Sunxiuqinia sp. A32]|uniref:hypothetical protein n=1 Tax=Sunxiuqinia sp. A32 TaxID=3461496 RepID=UPI0040468006